MVAALRDELIESATAPELAVLGHHGVGVKRQLTGRRSATEATERLQHRRWLTKEPQLRWPPPLPAAPALPRCR